RLQLIAGKIFPKKFMSKIYYRIVMGKRLDFNNLTSLNEKIQWYKLNYCANNDLVIKCSDKHAVRDYVKQMGFSDVLNPLINTWDNPSDINWDDLPEKFALKCNHGCGYNIICKDKSNLNKKKVIKILKRWLNEDFGYFNIEPHYNKIDKKIVCEKYIETKSGELPNDYKIYYFNGEPKAILACSERNTDTKKILYDLDWNKFDFGKYQADNKIEKPKLLDRVIEIGKKLAKNFPFVRIDFFDCEEEVIFGEMTFTPAAGMSKTYTEKGDTYLGQFLNLPK
ncbi:MAG: ATP-grasp fold amidoligase family protein, partial [Candidatus Woesearchaeota archaeon]